MKKIEELIKIAKKKGNEGWLGADVPPPIKARLRLVHKYIKPGDLSSLGIEKDPHITVAYGIDEKIPPQLAAKLLTLPKGAKVKVTGISVFENPEYDVLKYDIDSPKLKEIHKRIRDGIGLPGNIYKDYNPHITVAYLKKGSDTSKYEELDKILKGAEFNVSNARLNLKGDD